MAKRSSKRAPQALSFPLTRWGIREKLVGVVLAVIVVIFALTAYLFITLSNVSEGERDAERVAQRIKSMDRVVKLAVDMETGVRGFVLTGNDTFLEPYLIADSQVAGLLETLREEATTVGRGEGLDLVEQVTSFLDAWREQIALPAISFRRANDPDAATALVASGQGKFLADSIRSAASAYIMGETSILEALRERTEAVQADAKRRFAVGAGSASVAALFMLGLFGVSFTRALSELSTAATEIAGGLWGIQVDQKRRDELGDVAKAFNVMSERVRAQATELASQNEKLLAQQDSLEQSYEELADREARTQALFTFTAEIADTVDLTELARTVLHRYLSLYQSPAGALYVLDEPTAGLYRLVVQSGLQPSLVGQTVSLDEGPVGRCASLKAPVALRYPETGLQVPFYGAALPVQAEVCIPLVHTDQTLAVVVIGVTAIQPVSDSVSQQAESMAAQGAMAVARALAYREVARHLTVAQEHNALVEKLNAALQEEKKRADEQRDIYLSIITSIKSGACLVDPEHRIIVTNPPFDHFFGIVESKPGQPIGEVMMEALPMVPNPEEFVRTVRERFDRPVVNDQGKMVLARDGVRRVLHWYVVPVRGVGRLFVFRDNTQLEEIDRMKTEFISTVSHELRTPLTSILGYVDLILDGDAGETNPTQREFLEIVHSNTNRLKALINDILDIERIESGSIQMALQPLDMRTVVNQVARTFEVSAHQKGLAFALQTPGAPLMVRGDYDRLVQVVSNLVSNAVKYTRQGSVSVRLERGEDQVALEVTDTGIGMTEEEQERLFTRFFRADHSYTREVGGTGLGLSIVKALVEEHGGRILVQSTPGAGSTFTVVLPAA